MRDLRIKAPGQPPKFMTHNGKSRAKIAAKLCLKIVRRLPDEARNRRQDSDRVFSGDIIGPFAAIARSPFRPLAPYGGGRVIPNICLAASAE